MRALATFSAKASDIGDEDASFGLNHVTCNFDDQSPLKSLRYGSAGISIGELDVTNILPESSFLVLESLASHFGNEPIGCTANIKPAETVL